MCWPTAVASLSSLQFRIDSDDVVVLGAASNGHTNCVSSTRDVVHEMVILPDVVTLSSPVLSSSGDVLAGKMGDISLCHDLLKL